MDERCNFEFAFNNKYFSDRLLRIEVIDDQNCRSHGQDCTIDKERALCRKRRRGSVHKDRKDSKYGAYDSDNIVICNQLDSEDAVEMIESPSGNDSFQSISDPPVLRVNSMHISSTILAANSPFFFKLFSNCKADSGKRLTTLIITASGEAAIMELLRFMYSGKLSSTSPSALLDVMKAADKFEVESCIKYCCTLLMSQSMSIESALLYMELPSCTVSMESTVQPLVCAARDFLANKYRDISESQEELLNLPLAGIEAILSRDDLIVSSEDAIYKLVLKWAHSQYPDPVERREILNSNIARLVRFSHMTCRKLRKVLTCNDLDHETSKKLVQEALFFKSEKPYKQRVVANEALGINRKYIEREYKYRPVKFTEFILPHPQCIVYFDLKKEECANIFPSCRLYSQAFNFFGQKFFLSATCNLDPQNSFPCFGLYLGMQQKGLVSYTVDYEFSARVKTSGEFESKCKGNYTFRGGKVVGYRNLFSLPWASFMADDSLYFINGVLHLRVELRIKQRLRNSNLN